jgi:hypothetical protein
LIDELVKEKQDTDKEIENVAKTLDFLLEADGEAEKITAAGLEELAKEEEEENTEKIVISDAFLHLENAKPSYESESKEDDEAVEVKLELPNTKEDDEFEREEDDGLENADVDEDDAGKKASSDSMITGKSVNKVELKVNINVTNLNASKGRNQMSSNVESKEAEMCQNNNLLDLLFSFIGAGEGSISELQGTKLNLFSNQTKVQSRSTAGTTELMPGKN